MPSNSDAIMALMRRPTEAFNFNTEEELTSEHALLIAKRILSDLQWAGYKISPPNAVIPNTGSATAE